jgi:hypothetical protein
MGAGKGGGATATAAVVGAASQAGDPLTASAAATGGAGGAGYYSTGKGGAGGTAKATAKVTAHGAVTASADATDVGGAGGLGQTGNAGGGNGAAATATNAVTGSTQGGTLDLTQTARGGAGGESYNGVTGNGGAAKSTLTFDDTLNSLANQSVSVVARLSAIGGGGGYEAGGLNAGGTGGAANASLTVTGAQSVDVQGTAAGGNGGANLYGTPGAALGRAGGAATAVTRATGVHVIASATADGGHGQTGAGAGTATSTGTGSSGFSTANASSAYASARLVFSISATASSPVSGQSTAYAHTAYGGTLPATVSGDQAVAVVTGSPTASSVASILNANSNLKAAFAVTPVYFGVEQLGGGHTASAGSQTSTSEAILNIDLSQLSSKKDLIVGLFNPVATGAGFTDLQFSIKASGVTISKDFTDLASATAYFTNDALDLGSLAAAPFNANNLLTIDITMSVTTAAAGDSFSAQALIGDPPPASAGAAHMASLMAAFGPTASSADTATLGADASAGAPRLSHLAPGGGWSSRV